MIRWIFMASLLLSTLVGCQRQVGESYRYKNVVLAMKSYHEALLNHYKGNQSPTPKLKELIPGKKCELIIYENGLGVKDRHLTEMVVERIDNDRSLIQHRSIQYNGSRWVERNEHANKRLQEMLLFLPIKSGQPVNASPRPFQ